MNAAVLRRYGGLGDFYFDAAGFTVPGSGGGGGESSGGYDDQPWWVTVTPVASVIGQTLSSIWGNENQRYQQPIVQQQPVQQPVYQPGYYATGAAPGSQIASGVGAGISGTLQGIGNFLGVSPTTVIIGGAAALFLLFRDPPRQR